MSHDSVSYKKCGFTSEFPTVAQTLVLGRFRSSKSTTGESDPIHNPHVARNHYRSNPSCMRHVKCRFLLKTGSILCRGRVDGFGYAAQEHREKSVRWETM